MKALGYMYLLEHFGDSSTVTLLIALGVTVSLAGIITLIILWINR